MNRTTVVVITLVAAALGLWALDSSTADPVPLSPTAGHSPAPTVSPEPLPADPAIEGFCGGCHAFPRPEGFTMATWRPAIDYMYGLLEDTDPPTPISVTKAQALAYYEARAPASIAPPAGAPHWTGAPFAQHATTLGRGPHVVSRIRSTGAGLAALDMLTGRIYALGPTGRPQEVITTVHNPVDLVAVDLDTDGLRDLLVADLGTFNAQDNERGVVRWFRGTPEGVLSPAALVLPRMGRVAAVAAGDVDGNGTHDLAVAEFGWQKTGSLRLLFRGGPYALVELDARHGHIAVDIADLDGDGDMDVVSTVSQAHEAVMLYENLGGRRFAPRPLFQAPTPLWGAIGQHLVDIDADGDIDVLHFNGDALDAPKLADFQGVHLLENQGQGRFVHRRLASLPGVHDVDVADLDADGDLDIVAVANLPPHIEQTLQRATPRWRPDRLVFILQDAPGKFRVEAVDRGPPCFSSVRVLPGAGPRILVGAFGYGWQVLGHEIGRAGEGCDPNMDLVLFAPRGTTATLPRPASAGRLVDTAAAYREILRTDPEHADTYLNLGQVLSELGRRSEAIAALERATALSPGSPYPHNNLATAYDLARQPEKARTHAQRAVALDPNYADGYNTLSIVLHRSGDLEGALRALSDAARINPKSAVYPFNRGRMLAHAGRLREAESALLLTLELSPRHQEAGRALARVQKRISQRR